LGISDEWLDSNSQICGESLRSDLSLLNRYIENGRILDLGCDKGHISALLTKVFTVVCTIDIPQAKGEQLEINEERWHKKVWSKLGRDNEVVYQFYDRENLSFKENTLHAIVAYAVLEHVSIERVDHLLSEIRRILKREGYLFIFKCPRRFAFAEHIARLLRLPRHERLVDEKELQAIKIRS